MRTSQLTTTRPRTREGTRESLPSVLFASVLQILDSHWLPTGSILT